MLTREEMMVSVSLRSYIHSYLKFNILLGMMKSLQIVSVSLRSYIHSYDYKYEYIENPYLSFRLLMEYHSFLRTCNDVIEWAEENGFPSPYGVSFILISILIFSRESEGNKSFRLLTKLYSFLR